MMFEASRSAATMCLLFFADVAVGHDACLPIRNHGLPEMSAEWLQSSSLAARREHERLSGEVLAGADEPVHVPDEFVFSGHDVGAGTGQVLHLKAVYPGWPGTFDTGNLVEVSLELPGSAAEGDEFSLGKDAARLVFTAGFPGRLDMCLAYAESGEVSLHAIRSVHDSRGELPVFSGLPEGDYLWAVVDADLRGIHGRTGARDECARPCSLRLDILYRKTEVPRQAAE